MNYSVDDINFESISGTRFEEVCFDLLTRLGFQSLKWRQGGSDKGRDIEGEFRVPNPLVDYHMERWFFECKKYSGGVPVVGNMGTKFEWATAKQADHLVFFMVPYPTTSCRDWLDEMKKQVHYKVHVVEEKQLKALILKYPDLIEHHFLNRVEKLFKNSFTDWIAYNLFPDLQRFSTFCTKLDPKRLTQEELIFLLITYLETKHNFYPAHIQNTYDRIDLSQVIDEIYQNAQETNISIFDELVPIAIERLNISDINLQLARRNIQSITLVYNRESIAYRGHLIQLSMDQDRVLQVLTGRIEDKSELEVETRLYLGSPYDITEFSPNSAGSFFLDLLEEE